MKIKNGRTLGIFAIVLLALFGGGAIFSASMMDRVDASAFTADDDSVPEYMNSEGLIRVDNITQFPYGSTVRISMQIDGKHDNYCSGRIVAPNIVISAAHCFLRKDTSTGELTKERNGAVVEYATLNTDKMFPDKSSNTLTATKIAYIDKDKYLNSTKAAVNGYDIVFLVFNEAFQVKQFTAKPTPIVDEAKDSYVGDIVSFSGFPADRTQSDKQFDGTTIMRETGVDPGYMYKTSGAVTQKSLGRQGYTYNYDLSTAGGASGSGVLNSENRVIGVHSGRSGFQEGGFSIMAALQGSILDIAKSIVAENALTGWYTENGKRYYFESDGSLATGTKTIDNHRYRFSTTTGELVEDLGEIKYGSVVVKHVDQDGKDIVSPETILSNKEYGTKYTTSVKTFDKYESGKVISGSASGEVNASTVTVVYQYQIKKGSVIVRHVDKNGNDIAPQETIAKDQPYDTKYTAVAKNIENYQAGKLKSGSANGAINSASTTIVFEYELKRGTVYVRGVDEDGEEIYKEAVVENAEYGTKFTPAPKQLEAYHLDTDGVAEEATLSDANAGSTIEWRYTSKKGSVVYRAIDENGNEIARKVIAGGVKYGTEFTVEMEEINGYTLAGGETAKTITIIEGENIVEMSYNKIPEEKISQNPFTRSEVGTFASNNNALTSSKYGVAAPNTGFEQPHETGKVELSSVLITLSSLTLGTVIMLKTKFVKVRFM